MHELSVCQALLQQVREIARSHQAEAVDAVTVRIGPLSGVVPDLLRHAFEVARAGSYTGAARLNIEELPVRVHCPKCRSEAETAPNRILCPECGNWRVQVVSGEELLLARVELRHRPEETGRSTQPDEVQHV